MEISEIKIKKGWGIPAFFVSTVCHYLQLGHLP